MPPRDPDKPATPAIEGGDILDDDTDKLASESDDDALDVEVVDPEADPSLGLEYTDTDAELEDPVSGTHHPRRGRFVAQR